MTKKHISSTTGKLVLCPAKKSCRNGASMDAHLSADDIENMSAKELADNYMLLRSEQIASGKMEESVPIMSPPLSWHQERSSTESSMTKAEEFEMLVNRYQGNSTESLTTSKSHDDNDSQSIQYSFIKEFKEQEDQFNRDFEGFPNKFFNADLRGKHYKSEQEAPGRLDALISELESDEDHSVMISALGGRYRRLSGRLLYSVSAPSDNDLSEEEIRETAEYLGAKNVNEFNTPFKKGATKYYSMEFDGIDEEGEHITRHLLVHNGKHNKLDAFTFRRDVEKIPKGKQVTEIDMRSFVGARRILNKTGYNVVRDSALANARKRNVEANLTSLKALQALENAQLEGQNFISQRKYVSEHGGSVATAYEDKKNRSKIAQHMIDNTPLSLSNGGDFRHVEVDNDVDPAELAAFEKDYAQIRDKFPAFEKGKEPELRIRKLGKHKATGVFFPHRNTIAIDVRDSSSYVHELGHQIDIIGNKNASLTPEFREVISGYGKGLSLDDAESVKKRDYYMTPTEIWARATELYAHERLGIKNNRLLNENKFDRFDYTPFQNNPHLKEKAFSLLDKLFKNNTN